MDAAAQRRLDAYFSDIGDILAHPLRRESFATYAMGLLGEAERKSIEPIAARACPDPARVQAAHQSLQHFISNAHWDDHAVRRYAARYVIAAMAERAPVSAWIIDDTGFLKKGEHSVGVQRQYTGSAGKITNCQIGISLSVATRYHHVPIDFELYLPQSWAEDPARRREARIPASVQYKTKVDLALGMIERAVREGIPGDIVLADALYGNAHEFRETVRLLGFDYAVAIEAPTKVLLLNGNDSERCAPVSVGELGRRLGRRAFRRVAWREGTGRTLSSRFALRRVRVASRDGIPIAQHEPVWLLIEWLDGERQPTKFALTTLPARMSRREIVRIHKERYRTEKVYEELKGELGLDHFEGRRFPGWHHHVTVALSCYAFVVAERARHFSPSAGRTRLPAPLPLAA
ncbi:IS701 family transposase [Sorangium sp. So ce1097]|uniref:IS701 family transposase n=1 Tax=Sorangium sp. So ce1097 TaxID=3133330 RepID=UPI003F5E127A